MPGPKLPGLGEFESILMLLYLFRYVKYYNAANVKTLIRYCVDESKFFFYLCVNQ